jgi:hypothetical protein
MHQSGGRLTLLWAVLDSHPTHFMSSFLLLKTSPFKFDKKRWSFFCVQGDTCSVLSVWSLVDFEGNPKNLVILVSKILKFKIFAFWWRSLSNFCMVKPTLEILATCHSPFCIYHSSNTSYLTKIVKNHIHTLWQSAPFRSRLIRTLPRMSISMLFFGSWLI